MKSAPASPSANSLDSLPSVDLASARTIEDVEAIAAKGEPVILKGLIDHWPALAVARRSEREFDTYLRACHTGAMIPVMEGPPSSGGRFGYGADVREFSFTKRSRPLGETLERIARAHFEARGPYLAIQLLPLDEQMPAFLLDNPMPLVPQGARPKLWLGGPVSTQIHNDRDHNLACVVAGKRRFLLFPPEEVGNLYIGPLDNPPPLSLVDPEAPDFERFPRFRKALQSARVAHLTAGDALLMPRYWWHHVSSLDPYNVMVNYWWGDPARGVGNPHDAFLAALLAFKSLPSRERGYWQAMIETHVFGDYGADHIPPAARGILGVLTSQLRASLRQRLQTRL